MSQEQICLLCNSKEVEKIGSEIMCRDCGYGYLEGATEKGLEAHLQNIAKVILIIKQVEPDLTDNQITDKVTKILHKVENHPVRQDNYCEYCEAMV